MLTLRQVRALAKKGNVIPLVKEVLADTETPVSAYQKIARGSRHSFLLESVEGGERIARFSFIGVDPFLVFEAGRETVTFSGRERKKIRGNPIELLRTAIDRYRPVTLEGLPPFTGGAVGYFAYDTIRMVEKLPETVTDDLKLPEMIFGFYDTVVAFDNRRHTLLIIASLVLDGTSRVVPEYRRAARRIAELERRLRSSFVDPVRRARRLSGPVSNFKRPAFLAAVRKCKEYIRAGDIFQVVLSQRFTLDTDARPLDIYRMLRIVNPSPYNFFLTLNGTHLIGSSPELLVKVREGQVETRPLAGTRRRGKTHAEDLRLERELLADPKERAEHLMLVDLGRNDLGRVCGYGSVRPEEFMTVERYSHVMHISSTVKGVLDRGKDRFDALFSCMPAGTLSGAPKIRAMEIIDEVEPTKRLVYGGAIGYLDFSGNLDTCIAIRTIVMRGRKAHIQAGAGIVADSVPAREFEETRNKARAMFRAVEMVKERR